MARIAKHVRGCVVLGSLVLVVIVGRPGITQAGITPQSGLAYLRIPQADIPSVLGGATDQFSFMMWLRRSDTDAQPMYVIDVPGAFDLFIDAKSQSIRSRLEGSGGTLELVLPLRDGAGSVPLQEWILIAVSWQASSGLYEGWARAETVPTVHDAVTVPGFVTSGPLGDLSIGRPEAGGAVAQAGSYGLIIFRDHAIDGADFEALWTARDYFGPYRLANTAQGGNLSGVSGMNWMVHHAVLTRPVETVIGSWSPALLGGEVVLDNYCVYDATGFWSSFVTVGPVLDVSSGADSFLYESPFDVGGGAPFFIRQIPDNIPLPDPPYVSGVSPKLRQLAFGSPSEPLRCIVSANSRGARGFDAGEQTWPENYAHGFIAQGLADAIGVLNRPCATGGGQRWFGFDCTDAPRTSGSVLQIGSGNRLGFARMWTGSISSVVGPGRGVYLNDSAVYALKARDEAGSNMAGPATIRYYLLRFPGAGSVIYRPESSTAQDVAGSLGSPTVVDLNSSTVFQRTLAIPEDSVEVSAKKITFAGVDLTGSISAGDGCFVDSGTGARGFSVISTVAFTGGSTEVVFQHWFWTSPANGSVLKFGPWEVVTVEADLPALSGGDTFRGLELTASGGPIVVFAADIWATGKPGYVFGVAGWGGNGYTPQIEESFEGVIPAWMTALEPDLWLQAFAQQDSESSSMSDYLNIIRKALPEVEVAWIGDGVHAGAPWHQYILDNADAAGVVAATVVLDGAVGTFEDQAADGLRADLAHWSHRGNSRLAERWLDVLRQAALPSPDLNGDGTVGILDLLILLGSWGPCPPLPDSCSADLDGDGVVGILDLLALLMNWG